MLDSKIRDDLDRLKKIRNHRGKLLSCPVHRTLPPPHLRPRSAPLLELACAWSAHVRHTPLSRHLACPCPFFMLFIFAGSCSARRKLCIISSVTFAAAAPLVVTATCVVSSRRSEHSAPLACVACHCKNDLVALVFYCVISSVEEIGRFSCPLHRFVSFCSRPCWISSVAKSVSVMLKLQRDFRPARRTGMLHASAAK